MHAALLSQVELFYSQETVESIKCFSLSKCGYNIAILSHVKVHYSVLHFLSCVHSHCLNCQEQTSHAEERHQGFSC